MISVIVERPPSDRQGPDISDPLITSDAVAVERGRNEIDAACSNREVVSSAGPLSGYVRPGTLVEVADSERQTWRGMVKSSSIVVSMDGETFTADINLQIEREAR